MEGTAWTYTKIHNKCEMRSCLLCQNKKQASTIKQTEHRWLNK